MNRLRSMFFVWFIVFACDVARAQEYKDFTLEESRAIHQQLSTFNVPGDMLVGGDVSRYLFLHFSEFWPHSVINRPGVIRELPLARRTDVAGFTVQTPRGDLTLQQYVHSSNVDGVVILHRGQIVFEAYPRMLAEDSHIFMSVSKPFVSTLIAMLEERGQLDVSKSIDQYMPELKGSGWEGIPVIDILDMSSGIDCREMVEGSITNPETCFLQFYNAFGWPNRNVAWEDPIAFLQGMTSYRPSGEIFDYTSINTSALAWLVERVSGTSITALIASEIWQPMGAESDALMLTGTRAHAAAPLGISARLRDLARFGLLFTPSGHRDNTSVISSAYLQRIQHGGRPEILTATPEIPLAIYDNPSAPHMADGEPAHHATYQWDTVMSDGDFYKDGFGGQGLYISPGRDLVIAFLGTFDESGEQNELPRISRQLAKSGLFDSHD